MNISAPNYWILLSVTGDNGTTTTSSSSFSAKSAAQVEKKISEEKNYFNASLQALTSWLGTNLIVRFWNTFFFQIQHVSVLPNISSCEVIFGTL